MYVAHKKVVHLLGERERSRERSLGVLGGVNGTANCWRWYCPRPERGPNTWLCPNCITKCCCGRCISLSSWDPLSGVGGVSPGRYNGGSTVVAG